MGFISNGWMTHHLDRKRNRKYTPAPVILNMERTFQWNKPGVKATVHAISHDAGIQEMHFTQEEVDEFIKKFGPTPVPVEDAALNTLLAMADSQLLDFIERLLRERKKPKRK